MKKRINYSVIIPHRNIPDLLCRCLDSIPRREDIQIIIVDDNSDSDIVEFDKFPGKDEPFIEVYFTKEGRGAGYARNIGLKYAKGKWVLFADADDFFNAGSFNTLDKYISSDYDLVFFGVNSFFSDNILIKSNRDCSINSFIKKALSGDIESGKMIRYTYLWPMSKLYRRSIIQCENILFDEILASNDTMFGAKYSTLCKKVYFDEFQLYCITYRRNSLVTSYTYDYLNCRFDISFELYNYYKKLGLEKYAKSPVNHWVQFRYIGYFVLLRKFVKLIIRYPFFKVIRDLVNYI